MGLFSLHEYVLWEIPESLDYSRCSLTHKAKHYFTQSISPDGNSMTDNNFSGSCASIRLEFQAFYREVNLSEVFEVSIFHPVLQYSRLV